jgi:hypothetical protein
MELMIEGASESPHKITTKDAYLILLCLTPILIMFAVLGRIWIGFGAWMCSGLVSLVVRNRWDLRMHFWFWATIFLAGLLQIPLVLFMPWSDRSLTWFSFLPVAVVDFGLVYGSVKLVEKLMARRIQSVSSQ